MVEHSDNLQCSGGRGRGIVWEQQTHQAYLLKKNESFLKMMWTLIHLWRCVSLFIFHMNINLWEGKGSGAFHQETTEGSAEILNVYHIIAYAVRNKHWLKLTSFISNSWSHFIYKSGKCGRMNTPVWSTVKPNSSVNKLLILPRNAKLTDGLPYLRKWKATWTSK